MRNKSIYFLLPSLDGGGAERIVLNIIKNIDENQFNTKLILFNKKGKYIEELKENRIDYIDLKAKNKINGFYKVIKLLKKDKPNIFFTSMGPYNAILAPFLYFFKDIKKIARETNIPSIINRSKIKEGKKEYYLIELFYKAFYKNFDTIISQSEDMKNDLIYNYKINPLKIIIINNPVDVNNIQKKSLEVIEKEIFEENNINLISIGRLDSQKGYDILIKSFAENKLYNENIKLFIFGEGKDRLKLEKLILKNNLENTIKLMGFDSNPYKYLKNADIYILSSRSEGFPNVLLESLVCGIPVIANNCKGGINEILQEDINGKVINLEKENNLLGIIHRVYGLKNNSLEIIADATKKYNIKKIIKKYENIFEN